MDVILLKETFQRAKTENGGLSSLGLHYYQRLFEKYPSVQPLFKSPPEEQHRKLMASLAAIVSGATEPATLVPYLAAMGIRHTSYGTENAHYSAVGENLVAVLGKHLSEEGQWSLEMEATWNEAIELVASIMIKAAENPDEYKNEMQKMGYSSNGSRQDNRAIWEMPMSSEVKSA